MQGKLSTSGQRTWTPIAIVGVTALAALVALAGGAPRADAGLADSALGIPCKPGPGGIRQCTGDLATRVPSWDGVPLDANVTLPSANAQGPYPLIVYLHGWGGDKDSIAIDADALAQQGYAVLAYSARGFGNSCGAVSSRTSPGCDRGWIHLADTRYEARDTQYLAGLLADEGLVAPKRIGVTGDSYGGGQSMILAALKNRIMKPSGKLRPWHSPDGEPMKIAAAAPRIGWSDLSYSLVPNGGTLDFRSRNGYKAPAGIAKDSYLTGLFLAGQTTGFYAPPGEDPDANIPEQFEQIQAGEPYDSNPAMRHLLKQTKLYHSAYYVERGTPKRKRTKPAPLLIYNSWTDDLFPADEGLRYAKRTQAVHPGSKISLFFANGFGHPRAEFIATPELDQAREALFDRYLMGDRSAAQLPGVQTYTQNCDGDPAGPFAARNWRKQHPGEVDLSTSRPQSLDSSGGDTSIATKVDPIFGSGGSCRTVHAENEPGTAAYSLPAATGNGYTLLGSPTVIAKLDISGQFAQVASRLWDVAPDGTQTLVARGLFRPDGSGKHTFQLHPNGWHFAAGHTAKLELLGRDPKYARPSNGSGFAVDVDKLRLELPVRDRPGGIVERYSPPK